MCTQNVDNSTIFPHVMFTTANATVVGGFGVRLQIILYNKTIQKARAFALTLHSEKGKEILVFVDGKIPADKRFVAVKAGAPN